MVLTERSTRGIPWLSATRTRPSSSPSGCALILRLEEEANIPGYPKEGIPKESNNYPRYAALSYLDDLMMEGQTVTQLLDRLDFVVRTLIENNVSLNMKKFQIGNNVNFLGYQRVPGGLLNDPLKVRSLKLERIYQKEELKSVLGLLRFLAPSVPRLGERLVQFNAMTSKSLKFQWTDELQNQLQEICDSVSESAMRFIPRQTAPFYMYCDASKYGCAGFLYQLSEDKVVQPILFFSKGFNAMSMNWHVGEKEAYGLVYGLLKCRRYIEGKQCTVFTDHRSLIYMVDGVKNNTISDKVHRWLAFTLSFNLSIVHVKGEINYSDACSRYPLVAKPVSQGIHSPFVDQEEEETPRVFATRLSEESEGENASEDDEIDDEEIIQVFGKEGEVPLPDVPVESQIEDPFEVIAMAKIQKKPLDPKFKHLMYDEVKKTVEKKLKKLDVREGRLVLIVGDKNDKINGGIRYYVPLGKTKTVLYNAHNLPSAGHCGIQKLFDRLKDQYWFPRMRSAVEEYVKMCGVCQRFKKKPPLSEPLHPLEPASVLERVHVDIIGPIHKSSDGNTYILLLVDSATKYVFVRALPDKTAVSVAKMILEEFICTFGIPTCIYTDGGKEFVNSLLKEICEGLGTSRKITSAYHPQSNGQAEAKGKAIIQILKTISHPSQRDWDRMLPFAQFALNCNVPRGMSHCPLFLMTGKRPTTVLDLEMDIPAESIDNFTRIQKLCLSRVAASVEEEKVRLEPKVRYDTALKTHGVKVGDRVLVSCRVPPGFSKKLAKDKTGPFEVLSVDKGTARLRNCYCHKDIIVRNVVNLFAFVPGGGDDEDMGDNVHEVEAIVGEQKDADGETMYQIRWKGLRKINDSFRYEHELEYCQELLQEYLRNKGEKPKRSSVEKENIRTSAPQNFKKRSKKNKTLKEGSLVVKRSGSMKTTTLQKNKHMLDVLEIVGHSGKRTGGFKYEVVYESNGKRVKEFVHPNKIWNQAVIKEYWDKQGSKISSLGEVLD